MIKNVPLSCHRSRTVMWRAWRNGQATTNSSARTRGNDNDRSLERGGVHLHPVRKHWRRNKLDVQSEELTSSSAFEAASRGRHFSQMESQGAGDVGRNEPRRAPTAGRRLTERAACVDKHFLRGPIIVSLMCQNTVFLQRRGREPSPVRRWELRSAPACEKGPWVILRRELIVYIITRFLAPPRRRNEQDAHQNHYSQV